VVVTVLVAVEPPPTVTVVFPPPQLASRLATSTAAAIMATAILVLDNEIKLFLLLFLSRLEPRKSGADYYFFPSTPPSISFSYA
jgi:hypothetical protein